MGHKSATEFARLAPDSVIILSLSRPRCARPRSHVEAQAPVQVLFQGADRDRPVDRAGDGACDPDLDRGTRFGAVLQLPRLRRSAAALGPATAQQWWRRMVRRRFLCAIPAATAA